MKPRSLSHRFRGVIVVAAGVVAARCAARLRGRLRRGIGDRRDRRVGGGNGGNDRHSRDRRAGSRRHERRRGRQRRGRMGTTGAAGTSGTTGSAGTPGAAGSVGPSGAAGPTARPAPREPRARAAAAAGGDDGAGHSAGAAEQPAPPAPRGAAAPRAARALSEQGTSGTAGTTGTGGTGTSGRARSVASFDDGWLFFKGDATGADQTAFADTSWRALNVPHDWSIEGPFDQNAPTLRQRRLPAGRRRLVPQALHAAHHPAGPAHLRRVRRRDGEQPTSTSTAPSWARAPNGYISFRYEITPQATFGGSGNVIAVRANNSSQPASRWYAGAGIYRHVRLDRRPIRCTSAQWATFVTTPTVSTSSATVHVQTTVQNQGTRRAERDRAGRRSPRRMARAGAGHIRGAERRRRRLGGLRGRRPGREPDALGPDVAQHLHS